MFKEKENNSNRRIRIQNPFSKTEIIRRSAPSHLELILAPRAYPVAMGMTSFYPLHGAKHTTTKQILSTDAVK
jgi:hypothetical protein